VNGGEFALPLTTPTQPRERIYDDSYITILGKNFKPGKKILVFLENLSYITDEGHPWRVKFNHLVNGPFAFESFLQKLSQDTT
jgi:hypothetical protein